ncbi:MAG: hypothetical protein WCB49_07720 [Gammaproteobacteria bacterium]
MNADLRLEFIDCYWPATNHLAATQIFLCDNPLLERSIKESDIKPHLLGHWGISPGLKLIYVHLNRLIRFHIALGALEYLPEITNWIWNDPNEDTHS